MSKTLWDITPVDIDKWARVIEKKPFDGTAIVSPGFAPRKPMVEYSHGKLKVPVKRENLTVQEKSGGVGPGEIVCTCVKCGEYKLFREAAVRVCDSCWGLGLSTDDEAANAPGFLLTKDNRLYRTKEGIMSNAKFNPVTGKIEVDEDTSYAEKAKTFADYFTRGVGMLTIATKIARMAIKYWPLLKQLVADTIKEIQESPEAVKLLEAHGVEVEEWDLSEKKSPVPVSQGTEKTIGTKPILPK